MTKAASYAELHAHSNFSFLMGGSDPEELVAQALKLGLTGLALTDMHGLYAAVRFAQAAAGLELATVFGAELTFPREFEVPVPDKTRLERENLLADLVILARNQRGYRQLSKLISLTNLGAGAKGEAVYSYSQLAALGGADLVILTGAHTGPLRSYFNTSTVGAEQYAQARNYLLTLREMLPQSSIYVELTHEPTVQAERVNGVLFELAQSLNLPVVATTAAQIATPDKVRLAHALASLRARKSLRQADGWLPPDARYLRSPQEMAYFFRDYPAALTNSVELAAACALDLQLIAPKLPPFPVPTGNDESSYLEELVNELATRRYGHRTDPRWQKHWQQIDHELAVVTALGFAGYFLIVYDIVEFCRQQKILCQGRGSAANSAICYVLGITAVDAVAHGLLFDRFLSVERDGPPDIDIDIESDRREEVIQYVFQKYGRFNAAMVANVVQYRARSALRDAARALDYSRAQQDQWARGIEHRRVVKAPDGVPDEVVELANELLELPRHLSIHPGGVVLCDRPIIEVCPVEWGRMPGRTVLQWDKEDCADAGLVKFDLLGLGMLSAICYAFDFIQETTGQELALHTLPSEDPLVYDLLCAADTVGVFQVESRAQMSTLPRLKPRCFYDLVVEVALIRPGPIQGGSVHPYLQRAQGKEPITYLHPLLKKSLQRTLGVPLFQEQLMQMAIDCAGFNGAQADNLRRAMGAKRSHQKMAELAASFHAGTARNGISAEISAQIFQKLAAFADFGFPESHSYSFAYLVYASAWIKVHHPASFYAALLKAWPLGFYAPQSLLADARRHGQVILPPDIQTAVVDARVVSAATDFPTPHEITNLSQLVRVQPNLAVQLGLAEITGISETVATAIVTARNQGGRFASLVDLSQRVDGILSQQGTASLNIKHWESLIKSGALDSFGLSRRQLLWQARDLSRVRDATLPDTLPFVEPPILPRLDPVAQAAQEVLALRANVAQHPMQFKRAALWSVQVLPVSQVRKYAAGKRLRVAGVITHRQRPGTAKGVTFLSLEDETGILNIICTPGFWSRFRHILRYQTAIVVRGIVQREGESVSFQADSVEPLALAISHKSRDFQ